MLEKQGCNRSKGDSSNVDSSENDQIQVMKETLTQIEVNFQKDLRKLKALQPFVKGIEVKTPMKAHLKRNTQDMCSVWINHYYYMWKEILDMPDDEDEEDGEEGNAQGASGSPKPKSISDALLQLYFHLERCEQCVDGADLYMQKLPGLVEESQKARDYAAKCLDVVEKSRGERTRENGGHFPTSQEKIATRRYRTEKFHDESTLEHLYNQEFLTFVHEFRSQILEDYKAIREFTSDSSYRLFFRNDCMEVVANTLEEVVPAFLEFLSGRQQKLTGKRPTLIRQVSRRITETPDMVKKGVKGVSRTTRRTFSKIPSKIVLN